MLSFYHVLFIFTMLSTYLPEPVEGYHLEPADPESCPEPRRRVTEGSKGYVARPGPPPQCGW